MQTKCRGSFANNMHYNLVGFRVQFILICTLQITETVLREQTFTPTRKTTLMIYVSKNKMQSTLPASLLVPLINTIGQLVLGWQGREACGVDLK